MTGTGRDSTHTGLKFHKQQSYFAATPTAVRQEADTALVRARNTPPSITCPTTINVRQNYIYLLVFRVRYTQGQEEYKYKNIDNQRSRRTIPIIEPFNCSRGDRCARRNDSEAAGCIVDVPLIADAKEQ